MQGRVVSFVLFLILTASLGYANGSSSYHLGQAVPLRASGFGAFTNHSPGICNCASIVLCHERGSTSPLYPGVYNGRLVDLQIPIYFGRDMNNVAIRDIKLTTDNVKQYADAIHNRCWSELELGGLPNIVSAGILEGGKPLVYTHMDITISHNSKSEIVGNKISPGKPMPLVEGSMLHVTYSVGWPTLSP